MRKKINKKILAIFAVCLLAELWMSNAVSIRLLDRGKYEEKAFTVDQMEMNGFEVTGNILTYVADDGEKPSITVKNIDTHVGMLYLDLYLPNEKYLTYTVYYTDEANGYPMRSFSGEYVPEVDRTKWIPCQFSGKTEEIRLVFDIQDDLYQLAVNACTVNSSMGFQLNPIRFGLLFFIAAGLFLFREDRFFLEPYGKKGQKVLLCLLTAGVLLVSWSLYSNSLEKVCLGAETGDMYSQGLTDALLSGKASLDVEPSERLMELDNPYDESERTAKELVRDQDYIMDAAYYNGAYYVYFGVIPALLLFVPFKLLTGMYLSTEAVVFVFFCLYLIFLNLLLIKVIQKVMPETSFGMYPLGCLLLDAGSMVFCFVSRAKFYEMVYATGLAFSAIGLYLLFSSVWKEKWNYVQIFFGGLFLAFAVGCRPTMVLYSFLLVPFLICQLKKKKLKENVVPMMVLMIPYVIVAVFLMWYNYIRFGNVFDFGQNYQLTVANMAKDSYKLSTLPWCLWFGMFQPFSFSAQFPFVFSGNPANDFHGYFYNMGNVVAIFSGTPLLYAMFVPDFWRKWREQNGIFSTVMIGWLIGVGWLMAVLVFISAGVHIRYTAEAAPLLIFGVILLYCSYLKGQNPRIEKNLITVFFVLTVFSFAVAFLFGMVGERDWIFVRHPEFYYTIERAFCFWK